MRRSVQACFDQDGVFRSDSDGLIHQDLKEALLARQGIVVGQDARRAHREDFVQTMGSEQGTMSLGGVGGRDGEPGIMGGEISFPEELIGGFFVGDSRQAKLFDQAILMRVEGAFYAAFGLRAVGANDIYPQLGHGTGELGDGGGVLEFFFKRGVAIDLIDGVFINIEGHGTSVAAQVGLGGGQKGQSVLHIDELGVEQPAGGVVDIENQDAPWSTPFEPVVVAPIQLGQFPDARPTLAPGTMRRGVFAGFPKSFPNHSMAQDRGRQSQGMVLEEFFVGKRRAKPLIARVFQDLQGALQEPGRELIVRRLSAQAVKNPSVSLVSYADAQVADLPDA